MRDPVIVFYVSAGGGHRAAAEALRDAGRERGREVEAVDALSLAPPWFAKAYVGAHLFGSARTPTIYGAAFSASNKPDPVRDELRRTLDRAMGKAMVAYVRERRPRAVLATHFYPLMELGRLRQRGELDATLGAVITDYVAHAVWCAPGVDVFFTASGRAAEDVRRLTFGKVPIITSGIPIRTSFGAVPDVRMPRTGEPLRVLVTSGGFGVGPVLDVLRGFRRRDGFELDVVCGAREKLVRRAQRASARWALDAIVTGFARDMPERIARAHVVVGKPGGLTMSECLAAGRPLISVGACPGQETENERALAAWNAGVRARPIDVARVIAGLSSRGALPSMARAARANAAPDAAHVVLDALAAFAVEDAA